MLEKTNTLRIGPAGWSYEDWKSIVYPFDMPKSLHELTYLCDFFDTVEINSTFYHPPNSKNCESWIQKVTSNNRFKFTLKLWQRFTHDRHSWPSEKEIELFRKGIEPLQSEGKLGAILIQFPWSFKRTLENRKWLQRIIESLSEYSLALEIRHDSWDKSEVYKPYPPDCSLFEPANIQMVNLKSTYHPFTIVTSGNVEIKPYYMPMDDHRNIDKTIFITWPRKGHFGPDEDYTSALAHVVKWGWHEKTEKTLTQIYLLGMTDEPTEQQRVDKLVNLARSWEKAPELILQSDSYQCDGYEIKEKAYILTRKSKQKDLHVSIKASTERPLVNPAFVIKGMDKNKSFKLKINDTEFKDYRSGFEDDNLVIWIPLTAMKDTSIKLLF